MSEPEEEETLDPSDDECVFCGFPTFECKCDCEFCGFIAQACQCDDDPGAVTT